jgi:hypothetical protein
VVLPRDHDAIRILRARLNHIIAAPVDQAPTRAGFDRRGTFRKGPDLPPLGGKPPFAVTPDEAPFSPLRQRVKPCRVRIAGRSAGLRRRAEACGDEDGAGAGENPGKTRDRHHCTFTISMRLNSATVCSDPNVPAKSAGSPMGRRIWIGWVSMTSGPPSCMVQPFIVSRPT